MELVSYSLSSAAIQGHPTYRPVLRRLLSTVLPHSITNVLLVPLGVNNCQGLRAMPCMCLTRSLGRKVPAVHHRNWHQWFGFQGQLGNIYAMPNSSGHLAKPLLPVNSPSQHQIKMPPKRINC